MRSQGVCLARIAEILEVSRGTIVQWSRKFHVEIQNLRAMELEALREHLRSSPENEARALAHELRRVEEEIKQRDLAHVPTPRLYSLAKCLRSQLDALLGSREFTTPADNQQLTTNNQQLTINNSQLTTSN